MILLEFLKGLGGLLIMLVGSYVYAWGQTYKLAYWGKVVFSLISIGDDSEIEIYTIDEQLTVHLWPDNKIIQNYIKKKAENTTPDKPWIELDEENRSLYCPYVKGSIQSKFSVNAIINDAIGGKHKTSYFYFVSTHIHKNAKKMRILFINEKNLKILLQEYQNIRQKNNSKSDIIDMIYNATKVDNLMQKVNIYVP